MTVAVRETAFEPWREVAEYEARLAPGQCGAADVFLGTMRDFNEGDTVRSMTLEHYPGMTERHLGTICDRARERWVLDDILVIHRVGELFPGDPIVLVAVWSAHRKDAFEACRFIMEDLKSEAPFWKREETDSGHRWVEENTPGY